MSAAIAAVGIAAIRWAFSLGEIAAGSARLPRWDEAKHGLDGVLLADAIRRFDPIAWVTRVHGMAYWPPVFPILESPAFLLFGPAPPVGRACASGLFGATIVALFLAGLVLGGPWRLAVGLGAGLLFATSPFFQLYGTVMMLELPGALLTLLAFVAYARSLETGRARDWRLACAAALVLFLCKYNFGTMWLAVLALHEGTRAFSRAAVGRALGRVRSVPPRTRAFLLLLACYAALLGALVVTGGWVFELAGNRVSMKKLGNPVAILAAILLVRFLLAPRRNSRALRALSARLSPRQRTALRWLVLPIVVWVLLPPHHKAFFDFVQNRRPEHSLAEHLLWYPRDFVRVYSAHPWIGGLALAAALAPLLWFHRLRPAARVLTIGVALGTLITTLHPLKEARFYCVVAPLVWLNALSCVASLAGRREIGPAPMAGVLHGVTIAILGSLLALSPGSMDAPRLQREFDAFTVAPDVATVLDAVAEAGAAGEGAYVFGLWDGFSPALVEWHARRVRPEIEERRIPRGPNRRIRLGDPARLLDRLAADREADTILLLELSGDPPFAPLYRAEARWLEPVVPLLAADRRFRTVSELDFPAAGYRLRHFRRTSADASLAVPR